MNQLSWLLYAGNVADNLGPVFVIVGVLVLAFAILQCIFSCMLFDKFRDSIRYRSDGEDVQRQLARFKAQRWTTGWFAIPIFILFVCAALCPSSDTVYAIAASQMGEQALKTPVAAKAEQAIESWLDKQITPPKPSS